MYTYRNRNTGDEVSFPQPNTRLDRLPNWDRIAAPEPDLAPVESPSGAETPTDPAPLYDPADGTVDEVNAYLAEASPDEVARVLAVEAEGRNRSGIVTGPHSAQG